MVGNALLFTHFCNHLNAFVNGSDINLELKIKNEWEFFYNLRVKLCTTLCLYCVFLARTYVQQ